MIKNGAEFLIGPNRDTITFTTKRISRKRSALFQRKLGKISPTLAKLMFISGHDRCSHATFVFVAQTAKCTYRKACLRSCMGPYFNHMTYLNWPFTLLLGSGHRSRAGRSCLATGISHRYTEKSDRRPDIPRNR
jgi:hypothetical protein